MTKIFVTISWIIMLFFLCFLMTWFLSIVNTFGRLLFYYVFFFQYILAKLRVLPIGSDISYIWVTGGTGLELFPDCFSVHVLRNLILSSFSFSVFFFKWTWWLYSRLLEISNPRDFGLSILGLACAKLLLIVFNINCFFRIEAWNYGFDNFEMFIKIKAAYRHVLYQFWLWLVVS